MTELTFYDFRGPAPYGLDERLQEERERMLTKGYEAKIHVGSSSQMLDLYVRSALSTRATLFRVLIRRIREKKEKEKSKQEEEKPVEIPRFDMSDRKYFYGPLNRDILKEIKRTSNLPDFFNSQTAEKYNFSYDDYLGFAEFIKESYRKHQKIYWIWKCALTILSIKHKNQAYYILIQLTNLRVINNVVEKLRKPP